jgi:hypothetical protein
MRLTYPSRHSLHIKLQTDGDKGGLRIFSAEVSMASSELSPPSVFPAQRRQTE